MTSRTEKAVARDCYTGKLHIGWEPGKGEDSHSFCPGSWGGSETLNPLVSTMPRAWLGHSTWPQLSADGWGQPPHDSPGSGPSEQLSEWPVRAQGPGATPARGLQIQPVWGGTVTHPGQDAHPMPTCAQLSSQPSSPHGPTSPTKSQLTTQSLKGTFLPTPEP